MLLTWGFSGDFFCNVSQCPGLCWNVLKVGTHPPLGDTLWYLWAQRERCGTQSTTPAILTLLSLPCSNESAETVKRVHARCRSMSENHVSSPLCKLLCGAANLSKAASGVPIPCHASSPMCFVLTFAQYHSYVGCTCLK
jgi:hypothetical protein